MRVGMRTIRCKLGYFQLIEAILENRSRVVNGNSTGVGSSLLNFRSHIVTFSAHMDKQVITDRKLSADSVYCH
jgi:hypothetical protein